MKRAPIVCLATLSLAWPLTAHVGNDRILGLQLSQAFEEIAAGFGGLRDKILFAHNIDRGGDSSRRERIGLMTGEMDPAS